MTDDRFELSRRKALAALGTIGVASAGAGLGTSAYFSDQETFENNRLTAGTLDMVVDWEEHYSDWKGAETQYARMPESGEDPDYVLEAPESNPAARDIELVFSDKQAFWDATAIEAYPDAGDDGMQDSIDVACEELGSLDDVLSSDDRTEGTVNGQTTAAGDPLVNIQDVKPGDFGEVTLSFHLCSNPGFVWFGGNLVVNADGVNTEPEIEDPDEPQGGPGEESIGEDTPGELAQQIQVRAWYDGDCDNMYDSGVELGEQLFYRGTLADFLAGTGNQMGGPDGAPFDPENGDLGFPLSGDIAAEDGGGSGRNCFSATETHCVGFEWWLPIDHGNEVQGDVVAFDLGFYTEQCRHNDGAGMNAEVVDGQ